MSTYHIVGVDPGLVHTGVVSLTIGEGAVAHTHALVQGLDAVATRQWIETLSVVPDRIFIEKYVARLHYGADDRMIKGEAAFRRELPKAGFIRNTDSMSVVPLTVLDLLGVWNFKTTSHHQDLRAAARIAVFGMMKDITLNRVLADAMRDAIGGDPWPVEDQGGGLLVAPVAD